MALIYTESFKFSTNIMDYLTYGFCKSYSYINLYTNGPLNTNYIQGNNGWFSNYTIALPQTITGTFYFGARCSGSDYGLNFISKNNISQYSIFVDELNNISVSFNSNTLISVNIANLNTGWHYIEIGGNIDKTYGSILIYVDSILIIDLNGINNQYDTSSNTLKYISTSETVKSNNGVAITDIYVNDSTGLAPQNTFFGEVTIATSEALSNAITNFTPIGLTSNYLNCQVNPPNPTIDYNTSNTVGSIDTYNFISSATSATACYGIGIKTLLSKNASGPRTAQTCLSINNNIYLGPSVPITTSSIAQQAYYGKNPNTGLSWDAIPSIIAGVKITS